MPSAYYADHDCNKKHNRKYPDVYHCNDLSTTNKILQ